MRIVPYYLYETVSDFPEPEMREFQGASAPYRGRNGARGDDNREKEGFSRAKNPLINLQIFCYILNLFHAGIAG